MAISNSNKSWSRNWTGKTKCFLLLISCWLGMTSIQAPRLAACQAIETGDSGITNGYIGNFQTTPRPTLQPTDKFADPQRLNQFERPVADPLQPIGFEVQPASFEQQSDQPFTPRTFERQPDSSFTTNSAGSPAEQPFTPQSSLPQSSSPQTSSPQTSSPQSFQPQADRSLPTGRWDRQAEQSMAPGSSEPENQRNEPVRSHQQTENFSSFQQDFPRDRSTDFADAPGSLNPTNSFNSTSFSSSRSDAGQTSRQPREHSQSEKRSERDPEREFERQPERQLESQPSETDRLASARLHADTYRSRFRESGIEGVELTLAQCLAQSRSVQQRPQLVAQYWETWKLAADVMRIQQQLDWLEQIGDIRQAQEAMLLQAARSQWENRLLAARIDLLNGQHQLSRHLRRSTNDLSTGREELFQPVDTPLIKKYTTQYQLYRTRRQLPARFDHIDDQLTQTLTLIERQTDTVQWSRQACDHYLDQYQSSGNNLANLLEAFRLWNSAEQSWLRYVTNYNRMIADYSLTVADDGYPVETVVAMLIEPKSNRTSQPAFQKGSELDRVLVARSTSEREWANSRQNSAGQPTSDRREDRQGESIDGRGEASGFPGNRRASFGSAGGTGSKPNFNAFDPIRR